MAHGRGRRVGHRFGTGSHEERVGEFADVLAWATTIANVVGVDLTEAVLEKYARDAPAAAVLFALAPRGEAMTNHSRRVARASWPSGIPGKRPQ